MLPLLAAVLSPAHAATYDVELAVPSRFPPWMNPASPYGAERVLLPVAAPDLAVGSTSPLVTCAIEDGRVVVRMSARREQYPSLPFEASCSYLGDTLNIDVVAMSAVTDPSLQGRQIDPVTNTVAIGKPTGGAVLRSYRLPGAARAAEGTYAVERMAGATCSVVTHRDGTQHVSILHPEAAPVGAGVCELPIAGGGTYALNVVVSSAAI